MKASIIICTRNRADSLRKTLECIKKVSVPNGWELEVLVVDNGSTDGTRKVACLPGSSQIPIHYINEPRAGVCYARNAGVVASDGDIILFTDDDVRVPENWVEMTCEPILSGSCDAVAGSVRLADHLYFDWLTPVLGVWVASGTPGKGDLWGANMAFDRKVLSSVPEFDVELGPGALGFGDDTLFANQLVAAGFRVAEGGVEVEHHPDPARFTELHLVRTAEKRGQSAAYMAYHWEHKVEKRVRMRNMFLALKRSARLRFSAGSAACPRPWYIFYTWHIAYLQMYHRLMGEPRAYDRFGLVKKG